MATGDETKQDVKPINPAANLPTILMFQPTRFELVEVNQLKEWEEHLAQDVGLSGLALAASFNQRTACVSLCGRPEKRDDCDQI